MVKSFKIYPYLNYVFTFIPLSDEEQLGQALGEIVAHLPSELPQELFLILKKLCVVFVVHNFFQFHVLQQDKEAEQKSFMKICVQQDTLQFTLPQQC